MDSGKRRSSGFGSYSISIQVDGVDITDEELVAVTEYVKPLADSMKESPTEFELVCCIAFEYFLRKKCDTVVLEVGMGGTFDATNVIETPKVAVITNLNLTISSSIISDKQTICFDRRMNTLDKVTLK